MKALLFITSFVFYFGCMVSDNGKKDSGDKTLPAPQTSIAGADELLPAPTPDTLSVIAVGDIMLGTNYPDRSKLPPAEGKELLTPFASELRNTDICFGNVEGTFMDQGGIPKGSGANVYCFRQPVSYARYLTDNGFNLFSIANNHIADFGAPGMQSTVATLQQLKVPYAGLEKQPTIIFMVKGKKIGLAAFAPHKGCVSMNDLANTSAIVRKLKKQCHIVIVSFHGGAEGVNATHVPKRTEIFFGQNRGNVHAFSHAMIDAGADMVIGHGPHVPRAMELYKNKFIAYSLGNFCTYGMFSLHGPSALAPLLKVNINERGDFVSGHITSIKQEGEGGPQPDPSNGAFELIQSLSATDFPNNALTFLPGNILGKK
jgi:poly-gamma-glutamate capsule biosynthesis protein CapA/YwtB (metallophosphatase superfamily)